MIELLNRRDAVDEEGNTVPRDNVPYFQQFPGEQPSEPTSDGEFIDDTDVEKPYKPDPIREALKAVELTEKMLDAVREALDGAKRDNRAFMFMPDGQPVFEFIRGIKGLSPDKSIELEASVVAHNRSLQTPPIAGKAVLYAQEALDGGLLASGEGVERRKDAHYDN